MKFIVSSTKLLKQLQAVGGVLNTNNTLPILDNFLFQVEVNSLSITASDLETTMISVIDDIQANEVGKVAIPAKMLIEILKTFAPDTPITFIVDKDTYNISLSAGEGKYKLAGQNGDEFPKSPEIENTASIEMDTKALAEAINKTIFATGNDDIRPVMSGVFCELALDSITFVATDAHKLVRYRRNDFKSDAEKQFIMPKKPLNQLKSTLNSVEGNVTIEYTDSNAKFTFGHITLICRLIDGKYPNYNAVIPAENPNKLTIDRLSLLNSIKRVSLFSNQSTYQIRLKIAGSELTISAEDLDYANSATERLTCQYDGSDMEIGFNAKFVLEMLNNLSSELVNLEMSMPNRAGLLIPVDPENTKEDVLMLVMPVMLNQ
ncbi:MAG: DNA polymerase III subunit beta [Bacteroidota bacterium]